MTQGLLGLLAALASGFLGVLMVWLQQRGKRSQLEDAWQKQAQQLADQLNKEHSAQVKYLEGRIVAKDEAIMKLISRYGGSNE